MRIMVIDDSALALDLVTAQLRGLGQTDVRRFRSGVDAIAVLEADPAGADLIVCDLQMPEMDGIEVLRHLARLRFGGMVLLQSAEDARILSSARGLARAHHLHVIGALQKPAGIDGLSAVIRAAIGEAPRAGPGRRWTPDPAALQYAIAAGELGNVYQPKVSLSTGLVCGVEALVRWQHPIHGLVHPEEFIPAAEQHGLIDELTRLVLAEGLEQAAEWRRGGLDLVLAVNVSMDNLADLRFPDEVAREAARCGVPPGKLCLEVTESRLMKDVLAPLEILARLKLKRIALSIDDFGTGHSSLSQLRELPVDEIKIDRSFVHGVARDPGLRAIFDAACQMARELGLKIVAEGVEDRADWDLLVRNGCHQAQGYFIAPPMPGAAIPGWVAGWTMPLTPP